MNINEYQVTNRQLIGLMIIAYIFSFMVRMIWVFQFQDNPAFYWNNELMINTNDGYFWASSAQKVLYSMHMHNHQIPNMWANAIISFSVLFAKITPFSLETIMLYLPAVISSLVVIPMMLIARLYKQTLWGFFAALLGAIAWSYYNRTMVGYYDTDMFAAMAPMFILYFLIKSTLDFDLKSALYAGLAIAIYPFLYESGQPVIYAMGIIYALYMIFYHRNEQMTYLSLVLVFFSMIPLKFEPPYNFLAVLIVLIGLYSVLKQTEIQQKKLMIISSILFILFMYFGNVFGMIFHQIMKYVSTGTATEGLHFYSVIQTVREAGKIPFDTFANRISGSQIGLVLSLVGYIVLVLRHRAFILALPLIGIGMFALWGGLRFTVYAVPVAAMSAVYLFCTLGESFKDKKLKYLLVGFATAAMLYPNIQHIIEYRVPTVLNTAEVEDLQKLNALADSKDYTLSWWDYGYPIWYYSETSTLIDGGKHNNDNFIISKIMQTTSPELAANLSRLAVETYVDSNYSIVADTLFKNGEKDQIDPNVLLSELEDENYILPKKTRDIYLYLPFRMLNIFPTVSVFGNLNLMTGEKEKNIVFYPTTVKENKNGMITFRNGIVFNSTNGEIILGNKSEKVRNFIMTNNAENGEIKLKSQLYHMDGTYAIVYMQSYGKFIVMDTDIFNSTYVQMFILGKYDKNLFELVVASPYSRIYKLKR